MNLQIDHLPRRNLNEVKHILKVIFREFEKEQRLRLAQNLVADGEILKILLFGSYARGDFVEGDGAGYQSDYDILIIVDREYLTDEGEFWEQAEHHLLYEKGFRTAVNFLCHSLFDVNKKLKSGDYFFTDIKKEAVVLFEQPGYVLERPVKPTPDEALARVEDYMGHWLANAKGFYDTYEYALGEGRLVEAAFQLYQATERAYKCILLVLTNYVPHTHDLDKLRSLAERREKRLRSVFSRDNKVVRKRYQFLKQAYIDARENEHSKLTKDDLIWLGECVADLISVAQKVGDRRVKELQNTLKLMAG